MEGRRKGGREGGEGRERGREMKREKRGPVHPGTAVRCGSHVGLTPHATTRVTTKVAVVVAGSFDAQVEVEPDVSCMLLGLIL